MSYCRFQNTLSDFNDCLGAIQEIVEEKKDINNKDVLSAEEKRAAKSLYESAKEYIEWYESLKEE